MVRRDVPGLTLIPTATNVGFSAGNNLGVVGAEEPFVLFLNADTVISTGAIAGLLEFLDGHPDCVAVGPRLVCPDGRLQWSCRTFPGPLNTLLEGLWLDRLFPRSRLFGRSRMTWFDHTRSAEVEYVAGAAILIRRDAFVRVGGWPEAYHFYAEDADLCYSLRRTGGQVWFDGCHEIVHVGGASARQQSLRTTIEAHRSVLLFALRTGGRWRLSLQRAATLVTTLPRFLAAALAAPVLFAIGRRAQAAYALRKYLGAIHVALSPLGRPKGREAGDAEEGGQRL
jgi:hypothetical protein